MLSTSANASNFCTVMFRKILVSSISAVLKGAGLVLIGKVVAVNLGPEGVANYGTLQNLLVVVASLTAGLVGTGVITQYIGRSEADRISMITTGFRFTSASSFVLAVLLVLLLTTKALDLTRLYSLKGIFEGCLLFVAVVCFALNQYFLSVCNAIQDSAKFFIVTISYPLLLLVAFGLGFFFWEGNMLLLFALACAVSFVVNLLYLHKQLPALFSFGAINTNELYLLFAVSSVAVATTISTPLQQLGLRSLIVKSYGMDGLGMIQATNRISDGYSLVVTTAVSYTFLPLTSTISSHHDYLKLVKKYLSFVVPSLIGIMILIFSLRVSLIQILYTKAFIRVENLLFWQILGDFFRFGAFIFAYILIGQRWSKTFIAVEVGVSAFYILICWFFFGEVPLVGVLKIYALYSFVYALLLVSITSLISWKGGFSSSTNI